MMSRKLLGIQFLICLLAAPAALSQENAYLPLNSTRLRAMAMGGAVQAVRDDLAAISYNPATYTLYKEPRKFRITLFLSPVMPAVTANDAAAFFGEATSHPSTATASALSTLKGINVTLSSLDIGFVMGEPALIASTISTENVLNVQDMYNQHYSSFVGRLRLADQVAIGVSLHLSYFGMPERARTADVAASYGVFLKPNQRFQVGVSLYSAPEKLAGYRSGFEQLKNDAVNIGVAYSAPWETMVSVDLRNVGAVQDSVGESVFVGLEKPLFGQLALRGGLQYRAGEEEFAYSVGLGLLNLNAFFSQRRQFAHDNFALNYAMIRESANGLQMLYHGLNLTLRL